MDAVPNDFSGVLESLAHYFNGLHRRDLSSMKRVWHPQCHLKRPSGDGGVVDIDAPSFMRIVSGDDNALSGQVSDAHLSDTVQSIQFTAPRMAMAKVLITLGDKTYTDFLAMLHLNDGWNIVAKLFTSRCASLPYGVDTTPIESAHAEVGRAASEYVQARRAADRGKMREVLHPSFQMFTERNGDLLCIPRDMYIDDLATFAAGEADAACGPRRFDRVVSIDKSGPETAVVKMHVGGRGPAGDDRLLTDYLMLVRVAGGWRIVTRVYTPRPMD